MMRVDDIREFFISELENERFVLDKTGCKMIEMVGACFNADLPSIFGSVNMDYINREIAWYESMSLNVYDIEEPVPEIWKNVATKDGFINSNYGWCIYSEANSFQYANCLNTLKNDPYSRRAIMIYTRPSIQHEYNFEGMSDFICTNTVQYLIRDDQLHAVVNMRSNDVVYGYKNDYAWQRYVQGKLADDLGIKIGTLTWQVGSLHVYSKHFHLVKHAT